MKFLMKIWVASVVILHGELTMAADYSKLDKASRLERLTPLQYKV
ncbi:hypothetical protein PsalBI1_02210 [Piscirickettsia salmonis]|nr:hypothetical protein PsalBI1_02210 [Piscirickettsia salmonis]